MKHEIFTNSKINRQLMNKKINLLFIFCLAILTFATAQTPQAFNYSAVARNASGIPIATTTIGIQISILKSSSLGSTVYSENHFINTDDFGLFNLIVGGGSVQSGAMTAIDWSNDDYYLKVGMDASGGTNFLTMGTTQLLSVPYALHAATADSIVGGNSGFSGSYNDLIDKPITISSISSTGDTLYLSNGQSFITSNGSGSGGTGTIVLPTLTTSAVSGITSNSATFSGSVSNANGNQIIEKGFVYSTSSNPTTSATRINIGSGVGSYDTITGLGYPYPHLLDTNTTYYVRAYAINENNIAAYGNEVSFTTLSVGQTGPGGGIVFFDKGNSSGGWQYLETAPNDQVSPTDSLSGVSWGCSGMSTPVTQLTVGSGESNTSLIVNGCSEPNFAAKVCNDLVLGGQNDWFLPSRDEMNLMRKNTDIGTINQGYPFYWTSSSSSYVNSAYCLYRSNFSDSQKNTLGGVRAIRAF